MLSKWGCCNSNRIRDTMRIKKCEPLEITKLLRCKSKRKAIKVYNGHIYDLIIDVYHKLMKLSKLRRCNSHRFLGTTLTLFNENSLSYSDVKVGQGHMMVTYIALIIDVDHQLIVVVVTVRLL